MTRQHSPVAAQLAAALALLFAAGAATGQAGATRYVIGSWVNVRSAAAADAPVLTRLSTNTPVQLVATGARFCEVVLKTQQRGHIACELLGAKPLTLADVTQQKLPDGKANPGRSPLRAFWIAPSVTRLIEAGQHFWMVSLKPEQQAEETKYLNDPQASAAKPPRLVRFPVPEFEAMKELLKAGAIAGDNNPPQWPAWTTTPPDMALFARLPLPPARPSLWRDARQLDTPDAAIDGISERFQRRERIRILRGPNWGVSESRDFVGRYDGAWDIGELEMWLEQPVVLHTVSRQGLMGAAETALKSTLVPNGGSSGCDGPQWPAHGDKPLPDRPVVNNPLFSFYTPAPLAMRKVEIRSHVLRIPVVNGGADTAVQRLVLHLVDLDQDGMADFALIESWRGGTMSAEVRAMDRTLLVNLNGQWRLLSTNSEIECT